MTRVKLVEQHIIKASDPRFGAIDAAAFASKNLYNAANYLVRQAFIHEGVYLNNAAVFHLIKGSNNLDTTGTAAGWSPFPDRRGLPRHCLCGTGLAV